MSSPQNYPFLPPNLAREAARNHQMMEGAAAARAARAAQQAGTSPTAAVIVVLFGLAARRFLHRPH
jgi:hypothetical protein